MRKPAFCICENKDADQLGSNYCAADQRRWFHYTDITIPLLPIYEIRGWRSGAVVRASDFGPRGPWFEPRPVHISLWP